MAREWSLGWQDSGLSWGSRGGKDLYLVVFVTLYILRPLLT